MTLHVPISELTHVSTNCIPPYFNAHFRVLHDIKFLINWPKVTNLLIEYLVTCAILILPGIIDKD